MIALLLVLGIAHASPALTKAEATTYVLAFAKDMHINKSSVVSVCDYIEQECGESECKELFKLDVACAVILSGGGR